MVMGETAVGGTSRSRACHCARFPEDASVIDGPTDLSGADLPQRSFPDQQTFPGAADLPKPADLPRLDAGWEQIFPGWMRTCGSRSSPAADLPRLDESYSPPSIGSFGRPRMAFRQARVPSLTAFAGTVPPVLRKMASQRPNEPSKVGWAGLTRGVLHFLQPGKVSGHSSTWEGFRPGKVSGQPRRRPLASPPRRPRTGHRGLTTPTAAGRRGNR